MKNILVAGSTGLIGKNLTERLGNRPDSQVTALVRRPVDYFSKQVRQIVVDYAAGPEGLKISLGDGGFDIIACCIGSTMRAAGSKEAFLQVERDIPLTLIEYAKQLDKRPQYLFISSLGADKPVGFYLETKNSVELVLKESGLPYVIVRPSLLLGERTENRPGERFAQKAVPALFRGLACTPLKKTEWFQRYLPVAAGDVAAAMECAMFSPPAFPGMVLEGAALLEKNL